MRVASANSSMPRSVIVYTGEGKGKTSAGLGLICRALGAGYRVAFIQFIKSWHVSEDRFFESIQPVFPDKLTVCKGGKGFYHAGELSAKGVSDQEHIQSAKTTYAITLNYATSGDYDVIVCDEINNAVHDGLLSEDDLQQLVEQTHPSTTLCLTGRNFPDELTDYVDLISDIQKIKHPYDNGVLAQKGIDY